MNEHQRKSHTAIGKIYFWTSTIHNWEHLLFLETYKMIVIEYLKKLSAHGYITIYAFVIMPNHIHLIIRQNVMNGKETPLGSLLKYTAHRLLKKIKEVGYDHKYKVHASNKQYEIWKRDSLAIEIYSRDVAMQKLSYIHSNPLTGRWKLAKDDISYYYSSANFYESGIDDFGFLEDLFLVFDGD